MRKITSLFGLVLLLSSIGKSAAAPESASLSLDTLSLESWMPAGATEIFLGEKLYDAIDQSSFYQNPVDPACRSWMNVPFTLADPELDSVFLSGAKEAGLVTLKGHRSVGGMRASIYNAMPEEGVDALISFMADFEKKHG